MRITFNMQAMRYNESVTGGLAQMMEAAERVNSRRNLLAPENNASNYVSAYNIQRMIDELSQFKENAGNADTWLTNGNNELEQAIKLLSKAKNELATGGSNDTNSAESRKALADDVANIFSSLMDIANANYLGRYMFGGYGTSNAPFTTGTSSVSSINSITQNGGDVSSKNIFSDLPELKSGEYTAVITVENGIGKMQLLDNKGNPLIIDSNGSDESGAKGNSSATEMTFEYVPGKVINTGRGVTVKMPYDLNPTSVKLNFKYGAGSEMNYNGDTGSIFAQIGYNQNVPINIPGSNIFMQSTKTIQSTRFNTVNGMPATLSTLFSKLDKASSTLGDSIKVNGTDYSGKPVGSASILSSTDPKLDMSKASEKERTITVGYGDKLYKVIVPQQAYKTPEELADVINYQLKSAEFVGSVDFPKNALGNTKGFSDIKHYEQSIQNGLVNGKYDGEILEADKNKYKTDLSGVIKVGTDGNRLDFSTVKVGDNVRLSVSGSTQNALGFNSTTVAAEGKDTIFEVGYNFSKKTVDPVQTTHNNVDLSLGGKHTFYIDGKVVDVNLPTPVHTNVNYNALDFNGAADITIKIKDKEITIPGRSPLSPNRTTADVEQLINDAAAKMNISSEYSLAVTPNGTDFDLAFVESSQSQKSIEKAFDDALKAAGFFPGDLGVNISPNSTGTLDTFNVTFTKNNYNSSKDTQISSVYDRFPDPLAVPAGSTQLVNNSPDKFQQAQIPRDNLSFANEKTIGDFVNFVKDLYGNSVDVSLDNGKLVVKDVRSGASKMSMSIKPQNEGVGHADNNQSLISGKYTGTRSDDLNFTISQVLNADGKRDYQVSIKDKNNNLIYDKAIKDYKGGDIPLPYGLKLNLDEMGLDVPNPAPATPKVTNFNVKLTADPNLGFGDMNVVDDGDNVNIFRSLKNLENALRYNITKNGYSEPSAWRDTTLKSSAKPYLDGTFRGAYNDSWKFEVLGDKDRTDFYIQNESKDYSGTVKYDQAISTKLGNQIGFGVSLYNNITGKTEEIPVNIDLTKAQPPITDEKSAQNYIMKELNSNKKFIDAEVKFSNTDGKIEMTSGKGTQIASFVNTSNGDARALTNYIMGFESSTVANKKVNLDFEYANDFPATNFFVDNGTAARTPVAIPAGDYTRTEMLTAITPQLPAGMTVEFDSNNELVFKQGTTVMKSYESNVGVDPLDPTKKVAVDFIKGREVPAGPLGAGETFYLTDINAVMPPATSTALPINVPQGYYTQNELVAAIEPQLPNGMRVSFDSNGALVFKDKNGNLAESWKDNDGSVNALSIGSVNGAGGIRTDYSTFSKAPQAAQTDLSEASIEERTLTFKYIDTSVVPSEQRTKLVTLSNIKYESNEKLVDEINKQLDTSFLPAVNPIKANMSADGKLLFSNTSPDVNAITIEGDYKGTLGYPKAGDEARVKVVSEDGSSIQETTINTANKSSSLADGLGLGFNAGLLKATDTFTSSVGSGIENEIDILDRAEKQVLEALAIFGNRGSRVETVIGFQKTIIASNEKTKAGYLGSTEADIAKAVTDLKLSQTVYESAMSITSQMMNLSLLDFLR